MIRLCRSGLAKLSTRKFGQQGHEHQATASIQCIGRAMQFLNLGCAMMMGDESVWVRLGSQRTTKARP